MNGSTHHETKEMLAMNGNGNETCHKMANETEISREKNRESANVDE